MMKLKADRLLHETNHKRPLSFKQVNITNYTVQTGEHTQTNGQTDKQTDERYQMHYLLALLKLGGR